MRLQGCRVQLRGVSEQGLSRQLLQGQLLLHDITLNEPACQSCPMKTHSLIHSPCA